MTGNRRVVAVLFGGDTSEHEVSVVSARGVWAGFDRDRVEPVAIAVDASDRWLSPGASRRLIEDETRARVEIDPVEDDGARVVVAPGAGLLLRAPDGTLSIVARCISCSGHLLCPVLRHSRTIFSGLARSSSCSATRPTP